MPDRSRIRAEYKALRRRRRQRAFRIAAALGLVCSALLAVIIYALYWVRKF
jgi:high-affinity Fe2+/Pb2+ permease